MNSRPPTDKTKYAQVASALARTELARERSGLAVLLCISVLLRRMWPLNRASEVIALIFIAIGGVAWSLGLEVSRRKAHRTPSTPMSETTARLLSLSRGCACLRGHHLGVLPTSLSPPPRNRTSCEISAFVEAEQSLVKRSRGGGTYVGALPAVVSPLNPFPARSTHYVCRTEQLPYLPRS